MEDKAITITNKYQAVYAAKVLTGREGLSELGNLTPVLFDANVELVTSSSEGGCFRYARATGGTALL